MKKVTIFFLSLCLILGMILPFVPRAAAYERGQAYQRDLTTWIKNPQRREYVQMMLDHYIRTDTMVQQALEGGFAAVFLFDGCSDNLDDPELQDLSYYRVTGVLVVIKLDSAGEPRMLYINDNCSTIPDRPLEYGAWSLPEAEEVGPATVFDGTYQLYSVMHKGKYEALHMRTEYWDALIDAVYMTPEGYVTSRASEINVHTRTSNHTSGTSMWSAGCPLVGDGDEWEFQRLIATTYYSTYDTFEVDNFVGTITIDRQCMRQELYKLYNSRNAVDRFLTNSRNVQPEQYLKTCTEEEQYRLGEKKKVVLGTQLMTLPCSNATDARSLVLDTIPEGDNVTVTGSICNSEGNLWYEVQYDGQVGYLYSGHLEKDSWTDRLFDTLFT